MSIRHFTAKAVPAAIVLGWLAAPAHAALSLYTTAASFTAASTSVFTDTFNDLPFDFMPSPLPRSNGPYGYNVTTAGGLYGAGSAPDMWLSSNLSGATLGFGDFTGGVRGLGGLFFGSNVAGEFLAGQTLTLTATDSIGATLSFTLTDPSTTSFVGFVSNAMLVSVTVSIEAQGAWAAVNNVVLGQAPTPPIPEPGTWAMFAAGIAGVSHVVRRRFQR